MGLPPVLKAGSSGNKIRLNNNKPGKAKLLSKACEKYTNYIY
jgi:hypothetical protein